MENTYEIKDKVFIYTSKDGSGFQAPLELLVKVFNEWTSDEIKKGNSHEAIYLEPHIS